MARASRLRFRVTAAAAALAALAVGVAASAAKPRTVTVVPAEGGVVRDTLRSRLACPPRCVVRVRRGTLLDLRASPVSPFTFGEWRGWCVGAAPRCLLAADRSPRLSPAFSRRPGIVRLLVGGEGVLVSTPAGLQCGRTERRCEAEFGRGTTIELAARPEAGRVVRRWGGACADAVGNRCRILVEPLAAATVAIGRESPLPGPQRLAFDGAFVGEHTLTSDPRGIDCPPTCAADFPSATVVTLRQGLYTAIPFWERGCVGYSETCTVSVDEPTSVQVAPPPPVSAPPPPLAELRLTVAGPGTVVGPQLACGAGRNRCRSRGRGFTEIRLVARARPGATFGGWRGACSGRRSRCSVYIESGTRDVVAFFRPRH